MSRRIGIFGGSFDPVHIGHLWIAEAAREQCRMDEVRWIPAAVSPLKQGGPIASDADRLAMVRLAISGNDKFTVDQRELRRGETSYTVDTLTELATEFSGDELFLIIGSDSLMSLDRWHQPSRILDLITPVVIQRGGDKPLDFSILDPLTDQAKIDVAKKHIVKMPLIELSSSDVRARVARRDSVRYRIPAAVEAFISNSGLYL